MNRIGNWALGLATLALWLGFVLLIFAKWGLRGIAASLIVAVLLAAAHLVASGRIRSQAARLVAGGLYAFLAGLAAWAMIEPAKSAILRDIVGLQLGVGIAGLIALGWQARQQV